MADKSHKLRSLLREVKAPLRLVGAHNGLSARLVEQHGFEGIWASGFEIATSHALPDANILTFSDLLEAVSDMNDATTLPILVDGDTGFGNANNVIRTVRKLEAIGAAGVCIEDKLFPKVNSFIPGRQELASVPEFVGKIMAAKNAQSDPEFMVVARVEAFIAGWGLDEALKRAHAYADAGADAILIHSKSKEPDEIYSFCKRWENRLPLVIVPTTYPQIQEDELPGLGVRVVIYANHGIRAAIQAMSDTFAQISSDRGIRSVSKKVIAMKDVFSLQGMPQYKENEKKYVVKKEPIQSLILAAGDASHEEGMQDILGNHPVSLLDINGKTILARAIESFHKSGIQDIRAVVGFQRKRFTETDLRYVVNENFSTTHILRSLILGLEGIDSKVVVAYSDIIFSPRLLAQLTDRTNDFTLIVDSSYQRIGKKKRRDYVMAELPATDGERVVQRREFNRIMEIGNHLDPERANFEFIGIAQFSPNGVHLLKERYADWMREYPDRPFGQSENIQKAGFTDCIQKLIEEGHPVQAMEVGEGWAEIRTFEDYQRIFKLVSEQALQ